MRKTGGGRSLQIGQHGGGCTGEGCILAPVQERNQITGGVCALGPAVPARSHWGGKGDIGEDCATEPSCAVLDYWQGEGSDRHSNGVGGSWEEGGEGRSCSSWIKWIYLGHFRL